MLTLSKSKYSVTKKPIGFTGQENVAKLPIVSKAISKLPTLSMRRPSVTNVAKLQ